MSALRARVRIVQDAHAVAYAAQREAERRGNWNEIAEYAGICAACLAELDELRVLLGSLLAPVELEMAA